MDVQPEKIGRYAILSTIGRGAMGVVYKAKDPLIGRIVAIKTVTVSGLLSAAQLEEFKARFFREAQAAGVLHHPNIVTIHDVGEQDDVPFMAMEFVEGVSLSRRIKERGRLPAGEAVAIVNQVAQALAYANEHGIVHRDIKPDNILLEEPSGRAVVADFGVAHMTTSELTRTGEILGTPYFMSPEQVLGNPLDGRSDLFSLGVVFYLMLTGKRPFKGESVSSVCYHIVHGAAEPLPDDARVPANIAPVLERMLAKDPGERYPDGKAVVQALESALSETRPPSVAVDSTLDLASSPVGGVPYTTAQTAARMGGTAVGTQAAPARTQGTRAASGPSAPSPGSGSYGTPAGSGAYTAPAASGAYGTPATSGAYGARGASGAHRPPAATGGYATGAASRTGAGTLSATGSRTVAAPQESAGNRGLLLAVLLVLGLVAIAVAFIVGVVLASGSGGKKPPAAPTGSQQPAAGGTTQAPLPPVAPRGKEPKGKPPGHEKRDSKELIGGSPLIAPAAPVAPAAPESSSVTVIFETRIPQGRFQFFVDGDEVVNLPFESRRLVDGRLGFRAARTLEIPAGSVEARVVVSGGRGDGFTLEATRSLNLNAGQSVVVGVEARRFPPPQITIRTSGG